VNGGHSQILGFASFSQPFISAKLFAMHGGAYFGVLLLCQLFHPATADSACVQFADVREPHHQLPILYTSPQNHILRNVSHLLRSGDRTSWCVRVHVCTCARVHVCVRACDGTTRISVQLTIELKKNARGESRRRDSRHRATLRGWSVRRVLVRWPAADPSPFAIGLKMSHTLL
jgi:hypothetical protein